MQARAHLLRRNRDSDSNNSDDEAQTQTAQAKTQSSTSKRRKKSGAFVFRRESNCPLGLLPIFPPFNHSAYCDIRADPFRVIVKFQLASVLDFCLEPKKWEIHDFFEIGPCLDTAPGLF